MHGNVWARSWAELKVQHDNMTHSESVMEMCHKFEAALNITSAGLRVSNSASIIHIKVNNLNI